VAEEIHEKQGTPTGLLLQRAADGSHVVAYRVEMVRLLVSLAFGAAALVAAAWPSSATAIAVASAAWTALSFAVLGVWGQRETSAAAVAQESFDIWLYGLPWSSSITDKPLAEEELRRRARRSTADEQRLATWYPNVSGIAPVYAALLCQRENLTWDWRLRRRYAQLLAVAISAWIALGVAIGLFADLTVRQIVVRWFVPSASVLLLAAQHVRGHREIAREKEELAVTVRAELDAADPGVLPPSEESRLWVLCRSIQDGLLRTRKRSERVPRWLYERHRDTDEEDMRETAEAIRARLAP
jgi:hypothetical protein